MTTGSVITASVSDAQSRAGWPQTGAGIVQQRVQIAADEVDEETQAEQAEDDRGHAGQIVDRAADDAGDAARSSGRIRSGRSP